MLALGQVHEQTQDSARERRPAKCSGASASQNTAGHEVMLTEVIALVCVHNNSADAQVNTNNNTWLLGDVKFLFACSTQCLACLLHSIVIMNTQSNHVMFCISLLFFIFSAFFFF